MIRDFVQRINQLPIKLTAFSETKATVKHKCTDTFRPYFVFNINLLSKDVNTSVQLSQSDI
jgi:hypothetical protein